MSVQAPPAFDAPYVAERSPLLWLCEREVMRFLKMWRFTLAGPVVSALMYVVVFGFALSGRVSGLPGVPYDRFILPGLVCQAVITIGFVNGSVSIFQARHDRYIHDVLASPLRWWELNLALVIGGIVREIMIGGALLIIVMPITGAGFTEPLVTLVAGLALLITSAQIGVIVGVYGRTFDEINSLNMLVLLPLLFLGGIFYSISKLPRAWALLTHANPVFYFVQALRIGLLGHGDIATWVALLVVCATAAALSLWSAALFRSAARLKP